MKRSLAVLLLAVALLTSCSPLRSPENPGAGPQQSGYAVPTPGSVPDVAAMTRAVEDLAAHLDSDEFWELTFPVGGSVGIVVSDGDGFAGFEWRRGEVHATSGPRDPHGVVPLKLSEVDVPAIMAAASQAYATYYECSIGIESVGYQGQISLYCDGDREAPWTLDLEPMRPDFSSEQAMAATLALMGRGAPDSVTRFSMSGPADPRMSVSFVGEPGPADVDLTEFRGMSTLGDTGGQAVSYAGFDAKYLYPCAQQMMADSGLPAWHVWMYIEDDGTLELHWDINARWDPDAQVSVTNERCEVIPQ